MSAGSSRQRHAASTLLVSSAAFFFFILDVSRNAVMQRCPSPPEHWVTCNNINKQLQRRLVLCMIFIFFPIFWEEFKQQYLSTTITDFCWSGELDCIWDRHQIMLFLTYNSYCIFSYSDNAISSVHKLIYK